MDEKGQLTLRNNNEHWIRKTKQMSQPTTDHTTDREIKQTLKLRCVPKPGRQELIKKYKTNLKSQITEIQQNVYKAQNSTLVKRVMS